MPFGETEGRHVSFCKRAAFRQPTEVRPILQPAPGLPVDSISPRRRVFKDSGRCSGCGARGWAGAPAIDAGFVAVLRAVRARIDGCSGQVHRTQSFNPKQVRAVGTRELE